MKTFITICLIILPQLIFGQSSNYFKENDTYYFSALQGKTSKTVSILIENVKSQRIKVKITGTDAIHFKHLTTKQDENNINSIIEVRFEPGDGYRGISRAELAISDRSKSLSSFQLVGIGLLALEGENEASLNEILDVLDISTDIGWETLPNHIRPELQGEEIEAGLFQKATEGPVTIEPVARYSPPFILPFGYYRPTSEGPELKQVGILSGSNEFHEHQTLFPGLEDGSTSFDPKDEIFGFYVVSPTHNSFSEDIWNHINFPQRAGHAVRSFPVKDKEGKLIDNTYLICFEEASNGDYQDYVFLVNNIKPVSPSSQFQTLLQPNSLDGWDIFIEKQKSINIDPDGIFEIENGILSDLGKDLGYIITHQEYRNYHFKLEFKWGEKKWPPRDNAKRDSGICYHIPKDEENKIWPQSVECQIQEGDVGDFWLLGYSTIEVDGKQNKPYKHSQIVKAKDNELPNGEWNTVEVLTLNGICVHLVNGVVVNYGTNSSLRKGRILIQSEYAELYYRNIKIRTF